MESNDCLKRSVRAVTAVGNNTYGQITHTMNSHLIILTPIIKSQQIPHYYHLKCQEEGVKELQYNLYLKTLYLLNFSFY